MRLLATVLAAVTLANVSPAWAWQETMPGEGNWPPIPGNAGLAYFFGTWNPQCNVGAWQEHGLMTLRPRGRIEYQLRHPYLPTAYRIIEETPNYAVLMVRRLREGSRDLLDFWIIRLQDRDSAGHLGIESCRPWHKELEGFDWSKSDDGELRKVWRNSRECHPDFTRKYPSNPFLGDGWGQYCEFTFRAPLP